jgi:hypothetical protein
MTTIFGSIKDMSDEALGALLGPLRERNRGRLVERLNRVRAAISNEHRVPLSDQVRADLHALIGALGTYGWPAGSELVARIQTMVTAGRPARELVPELDEVIASVAGPGA